MKSLAQIKVRLLAEEAACKEDPSLMKNEFVQGYMEGLRFVLEDERN